MTQTLDESLTVERRVIFVEPRYWVPIGEVDARLMAAGWHRRWLMGFRGITNGTNERSFIGSSFPRCAVGNSLPIMLPKSTHGPAELACLQANIAALVTDYVARQKIGGTNLNFFIVKQFAILPPSACTQMVVDFLLPRILELSYTASDMRPWAKDLGYKGPPFEWDEERRARVRADLDAAYAYLYGLTRDEIRYILDPTDIYGSDLPSETFRVLKEKEVRMHRGYRTARLVLAAWDRLQAEGFFSTALCAA